MTPQRFSEIVNDLEARVREQLASAGGDGVHSRVLVRLDMRYVGQGYEVEVLLPEGEADATFASLAQRFNAAYAAIFGMSFDDREIEIVAWKVEVQGDVPGGYEAYRLRTPETRRRRVARPPAGVLRRVRRQRRLPGVRPLQVGARRHDRRPGTRRGGRVDLRGRLRRPRPRESRRASHHRHRRDADVRDRIGRVAASLNETLERP
jgi:N-methylhydantoinase A/oxoprolinase/acetone carboxylase beta subunit